MSGIESSSSFHGMYEKGSVQKGASCSTSLELQPFCNEGNSVTLLSLPDDLFQEILSRLSYDDISKLRLVNMHFKLKCFCNVCLKVSVVGKSPLQ